jgi:hypothetical protein
MMAGALADEFRTWLLRPRIVHRLPGRLRLHIPALKHIDSTHRDWAFLWQDLLRGMIEIQSIEVNLTTGNALIHYHPDQLTEAELLGFLRAANRVVLRHWDRLAATPPAELSQAVQRLVAAIRAGIRHRLVLDDKIEISTDVQA